jgi:hypothetical protein
VLDGQTGLLVDDLTGFAIALHRLLTEPGLRESMGRAARAHAARFSWPATAGAVEAELRALTGLPPRPAELPVSPLPAGRRRSRPPADRATSGRR